MVNHWQVGRPNPCFASPASTQTSQTHRPNRPFPLMQVMTSLACLLPACQARKTVNLSVCHQQSQVNGGGDPSKTRAPCLGPPQFSGAITLSRALKSSNYRASAYVLLSLSWPSTTEFKLCYQHIKTLCMAGCWVEPRRSRQSKSVASAQCLIVPSQLP